MSRVLLRLLPATVQGILLGLAMPVAAQPQGVDSAALRVDPQRDRCSPTAADEPATRVYYLKADPSWGERPRRLVLGLTVRLGGPADRVACELSYDDATWLAAGGSTFRNGPQTIDLSPFIHPGRFRVRLSLSSRQPPRCWVSALRWELRGVLAEAPEQPWLPASAWLQPAWAALTDRRLATGLPPGRTPDRGSGRQTVRAVTAWEPLGQSWLAGPWSDRGGRGATRQLVSAGGPRGGRLELGQAALRHELPWMPLGLELDDDPAAPPPRLVASGLDPPDVRLLLTGPLELRYDRVVVEPRLAGGRRVRLEPVVVNHRPEPLRGNITGRLLLADGSERLVRSGYSFPPGPSLATLLLDLPDSALHGRLRLTLDDGSTLSDERETDQSLSVTQLDAAGLRLNGRQLRPMDSLAAVAAEADAGGACLRLTAPADPATLDLAARQGVAVWLQVPVGRPDLLASETLLAAERPAVVAVSEAR